MNLDEFIKKVRLSIKSGQKEIRISSSEAENICHNLNIITLKLLDKLQNNDLTKESEVISVVMDGGSFGENR
jgi:hypothetical protein